MSLRPTKAFTVAHHEGMLQRCEQSALLRQSEWKTKNGKRWQKWCLRMCTCQNWRILKLQACSHLDNSINSTNFTQSPWLHLPPAHQPKLQPQSATGTELSINRFHKVEFSNWCPSKSAAKVKAGWKCGNSTQLNSGLFFGRFTNVHNLETANGQRQKLRSTWVDTCYVIFGAIEIRIIPNDKSTV